MLGQMVMPPSFKAPLPVPPAVAGARIVGDIAQHVVRFREPQGRKAPNHGTLPGSAASRLTIQVSQYGGLVSADQVRETPPRARARQQRAHPRRVDPDRLSGQPVSSWLPWEDVPSPRHRVHGGKDIFKVEKALQGQ